MKRHRASVWKQTLAVQADGDLKPQKPGNAPPGSVTTSGWRKESQHLPF